MSVIAPSGPEASAVGQASSVADGSSALDQVLASLREHRALAVIVLAYVAVCYLLRLIFGYDVLAPIGRSTLRVWSIYTLIALSFPIAYHLIRFQLSYSRKPTGARGEGRGGLAQRWAQYRRQHFSVFRISGVIVACAILSIFMTTFLAYKRAIPLFHPFAWDLAFMRADRAVHLGTHPWEMLQPLFGSVSATVVIDWVYVLWLRTIPLVIAWQVWNRDRELRARFLLTYAISSILIGTVLATWLSSAGPCYYAEVVGQPDPYVGLFAALGDVSAVHPLNVLRLQDLLWQGYLGNGQFYGISAMPSMHVALPTLYVLVGFRTRRWLGWVFVAYLLAILIGSVHLGWHYAIDGYVSILAVWVVWVAVGLWKASSASGRMRFATLRNGHRPSR
jgi:hypothetical protein